MRKGTSMEIQVVQRSDEWFKLRRTRVVTASRFGDIVGVGKGRPYDFFLSLLQTESQGTSSTQQHGIDLEPAIHEGYQLLTKANTRESGFWVPAESDGELHALLGASPDAIVLEGNTAVGLCEFKAPVYRMYPTIPRQYMAQVQGQMAVTGLPWCDFMAVCCTSREIILKRVYFSSGYWNYLRERILEFIAVVQEARNRVALGHDPTDFDGAQQLKGWEMSANSLPGEDKIVVENLLIKTPAGNFCGPSEINCSFDFLLGNNHELPEHLVANMDTILAQIDFDIDKKEIENALSSDF